MKKIVIPAILTATILVAGMFAFMPVEKVTTVHTTLSVAKNMQTTNSLSGIADDGTGVGRVVVVDTTNVGTINKGHFAAVLPITDDDTTCTGGESPFAGLAVKVGIAGVSLPALTITATSIEGGPDVIFNADAAAEAQCVFHADFASGVGGVPASSTDVVFENDSGFAMPANASITVSILLT